MGREAGIEFPFYKMHTAGNDFILANFLSLPLYPDPILGRIAKRICPRLRGIGGNGVIFLVSGEREKIRLRTFNSQGMEYTNLFDPFFCVGKYLFNSGFSGNKDINLEYGERNSCINIIDSSHFRINLGIPRSFPSGKLLREDPVGEYSLTAKISGKTYSITPLSLEYPMGVVFETGESRETLKTLSRDLRLLEKPDLRALQPVFITPYSREEIQVKVWFGKGNKDYTSACAGAFVASVVQGFTDREVLAHCQGNSFFLQWTQPSNLLYCTGEAEYIYYGNYYYESEEE